MAPSSSSSSTATSVQVALRIRPPTSQDSTSIPARFQRSVIQAASSTSVSVEPPSTAGAGASSVPTGPAGKKQVFTFDQVHGPPTTQYAMFETTAKPLISRFTEGFNCTILAYGQTSSGKTFTMTGVDLDADPSDPNNGMGIIPRAVSTIFTRAKQIKEERAGSWSYNIKASFIEIYNEDLIDLLSLDDAMGGKREVQIREDKEGHIIWEGLREVNVRNANEVMGLLRKGTSIRRTNETDMNAQSSRSHAIFSLTLTQKRYSGSGPPPRSSSPLPPGGRSPSRLARPGSMYATGPSAVGGRVASPPLGRPSTPSFASAMNRGGLRPASALGHSGDRSSNTEDEAGEWVTITSKFHFVDLAGSERLKRTAAQGERIKEGISINSGLLALGNVISALGDPSRAKSNTASYVPYRDSKLTRLLQDSLGGNAHTLMIACVSPAEWNSGETLNTLKYANRARNIKNRAVVNEKEDGWDDVEWLQGTVVRLRKDLKALKDGGVLPADREPEVLEGAGKKVLAQMTDLQNNYEDLREKFVERTEELTRLRRELGERHRLSSTGNIGGTAKYEEIVGPVIEEYEKTISAMEAELSLNRAALRHTNEMVEEKEEELAAVSERHAATELYVEELRSRVVKLSEREASTEAYIHDLEEKMKAYDETSLTSNESLADLKREVARYKDAEAHSTKYIADLEARLAKSDESILSLQQTVESLERESERRSEEVETLQSRLEAFKQDGESWRTDLEERERQVRSLEEKMLEWEDKKNVANEARSRLGEVIEEVVSARRSLELDLANAPSPRTIVVAPSPVSESSPASDQLSPSPVGSDNSLEEQLLALQQTHTATLADLSSVSAKYRDALREISDLAAQIQEAKLSNPTIAESVTAESPATDRPTDTPPPFRRRLTSRVRDASEPQFNSSGRRLFFRQAASAESLHTRSLSQSQSLSQELSSVHSRKASFSSHGTGSSHSPSHSTSTLHTLVSRPNLSISLPSLSPTMQGNERSVSSLENEIMRLQEVLKERETEITLLEASLKEIQQREKAEPDSQSSHEQPLPTINGNSSQPSVDATLLNAALSPKTLNQFDHIRKTMEVGNGHPVQNETGSSVYSDDESLERLNEVMLSMAQKESCHREVVEGLNTQLSQTKRQLDELTALSRDQALNMSMELEALRGKHEEDLVLLEEVRQRETDLRTSIQDAEISHATEIEELRVAHAAAMKIKGTEVAELLLRMNENVESPESSFASLRAELEATSIALKKAKDDHETAFGALMSEHEKELQLQIQDASTLLNQTRDDHEKTLSKILIEHTVALREKDEQTAATQQTTEEEYYNALTKLRGDHAEAIKMMNAEAAATIERLREEHAGDLQMAETAPEGSLTASESSRNLAIKELQEQHAAAITRKDISFAEELENLKAGHGRDLQAKDDDHSLKMDRLRLEQETVISKLKVEWRTEVQRLTADLATEQEIHATTLTNDQRDFDAAIQNVREQQTSVLRELERGHEEEVAKLKISHQTAFADAITNAEADKIEVLRSHVVQVEHLRIEHQKELADLNAKVEATHKQHRLALQEAENQASRFSQEQKDRHASLVQDLQNKHLLAQDAFQTECDLLIQEMEAHKAATDEFTMLREEARQLHEHEAGMKEDIISTMQQQLTSVGSERNDLEAEVAKLRNELSKTRGEQSKLIQEASKRESLVVELERHRSVLAELQENLQKVKDEKDTLQTEKNRSDSMIRDLQAQVARSASPPNARSPDRAIGYPRSALPSIKLPPPTPPPSVPPPPAPRSQHLNGDSNLSTSSQGSSAFTSSATSSRDSQPESPSTSVGHIAPIGVSGFAPLDTKVAIKIEEQAKQLEEQEAMIKTLNKQLTHCESDLQTHMDLVNKLENSLGDAEKNLRKARMQATELARERDTLNGKLEHMRNELSDAQREVVTVRRSVVEEKQSLEQRLDEERKAKERARQQLDSRMDELQRRKSKFACL